MRSLVIPPPISTRAPVLVRSLLTPPAAATRPVGTYAHAFSSTDDGSANSAFGWGALASVSSVSSDTAVGYRALYNNFGGVNTAIGTMRSLATPLPTSTPPPVLVCFETHYRR